MTLAVYFNPDGTAEWKTLTDAQCHTRPDAQVPQVLQSFSIAVNDSFYLKTRTRCSLFQRAWPLFNVTLQICGWNWISMRVVGRVAENLVDALFERPPHHVLEHLGMLVHLVPIESEYTVQEQLDEAMAPYHSDGDRFAACRQLHLVAWTPNNQLALLEAFEHGRH